MRPIKFRVWSNELSKMIYPDEKGWFQNCFIGNNQFYQTCSLGVAIDKNGKELELMEYTGTNDKNGKEIYEGDIVQSTDSRDQVVFKNGAFYMVSLMNPPQADELLSEFPVKIVGNIYESGLL